MTPGADVNAENNQSQSKQEFNFDDFGEVDEDEMNKSEAGEDSRVELEKMAGVVPASQT